MPIPNPESTSIPTPIPVTINQAPYVAQPISDQTVSVNEPFAFSIESNTFADPDKDPLSYRATQEDGSALPSWLEFTNTTLKFSGQSASQLFKRFSVFATDPSGASARADFGLNITEKTNAGFLPDHTKTESSIAGIAAGVTAGVVGLGLMATAGFFAFKTLVSN